MRGVLDKLVRPFGYRVIRCRPKIDQDIAADMDFMHIYEACKSFTMTSIESMYGPQPSNSLRRGREYTR